MITHQPVNNHDDLLKVVDGILNELGLSLKDFGGKLTFAGMDPIRATVFKVGATSAIVAAANAVASALIWQERTGETQDIHIDLRKAWTIQSCWQDVLYNCTTINGVSVMLSQNLTQVPTIYKTKDNRHVMVSALYPRSFHVLLNVLDCGPNPEQMQKAILKWNAKDLETACQNAETCLTMVRTQKEYQAEEQYKHHAEAALITVEKIGDSEPEPLGPAERPLSGIRALGMTHVVSGPVVLRELAHHGAECLNLNTLDWLEIGLVYMNCDVATRQAYLDGRIEQCRPKIYELIKDADIFVENLRPGCADQEGFSAEEIAKHRPGIIYASIRLCGPTGPWSGYLGFDFNAAALTGMFTEEGTPEQPETPHDVNVVCDFIASYLVTTGIKTALLRRAKEGGSYKVHVNLAQTTMFMLSLGLIDKKMLLDIESLGEEHQRLEPNLQSGMTPFGEYTRLGSQVEMSKTPEYWDDPLICPIGSCKPEWIKK